MLAEDAIKQCPAKQASNETEDLFREIAENTIDMILKADNQWIIQYATPSYKSVLGYESEEMLGKYFFGFLHPDDALAILCDIKEAEEGGKACDMTWECMCRHVEGHYLWLEIIGKKLYNQQGKQIGNILCSRDITKRVRTEHALRKSEQQYKSLVEMLPDAVFTVNKATIEFANAAMARLLGFETADEIIGKKLNDFCELTSENSNLYQEAITELNSNGYYSKSCLSFIRKSDYNIVNVIVAASILPNDGYDDILVVLRDITDKKNAAELRRKIQDNIKRLTEAMEYDKIKTEFFANISHELKTPLNLILGTLQLMDIKTEEILETHNEEKLGMYKEIMKQNSYRLLRIINNLIDFTQIDVGYLQLNCRNIDIVHLVKHILASIEEYCEIKGIKLYFETSVEEKIMACDPEKIERILLNLISNAIKFTEQGKTIYISIQENKETISLSVKDTGIGIPQEKLQMIFQRFGQVDKSISRNCEGSGIGLSLVKSLVEMHNGSIKVRSEVGKGSEFIIELPVELVSDEQNVNTYRHFDLMHNKERIQIEFSDIYS